MIECKLLTPESCDLSLVKGFQGSVKFRPYLLREHWFKFPGALPELLELTLRYPIYGIRFPTYWHDFEIRTVLAAPIRAQATGTLLEALAKVVNEVEKEARITRILFLGCKTLWDT